jgi:prophage regulatory protein
MNPQIDTINRPRQVWTRLQIGKSTLQRLVKSGEFPPPIQISPRCVGWRESTILEYLAWREKLGAGPKAAVRYRRSDIDEFICANVVSSTSAQTARAEAEKLWLDSLPRAGGAK